MGRSVVLAPALSLQCTLHRKLLPLLPDVLLETNSCTTAFSGIKYCAWLQASTSEMVDLYWLQPALAAWGANAMAPSSRPEVSRSR